MNHRPAPNNIPSLTLLIWNNKMMFGGHVITESRCERTWRLEPRACYIIACACICIGMINVRFHSEADASAREGWNRVLLRVYSEANASACEGWNRVLFARLFRGRCKRMRRLEPRAFARLFRGRCERM